MTVHHANLCTFDQQRVNNEHRHGSMRGIRDLDLQKQSCRTVPLSYFFLSFFLSLSLNEVIPCERRNDHDYTSSRRISAKDLPHSQPTRPLKCGKTDIQPTDTTMAGAGAGAEIVSARNHEVISSKIIFLARKMKSRWGGNREREGRMGV